MEKVKVWITWPDGSKPGWYHCQFITESGWPVYSHLCSSPGYAQHDLWEGRKERKDDWAKRGIEVELVDSVPQSELPAHILENNKAEAYVPFVEKYWPELKKKEQESEHVHAVPNG